MAKSTPKKSSAPLTFDLPVTLIDKIESTRKGLGLDTASEVVRLAIENFDFEKADPVVVPHRQISVRITTERRNVLKKAAKKKDTSVGELLRLALDALAASKPKRAAKK